MYIPIKFQEEPWAIHPLSPMLQVPLVPENKQLASSDCILGILNLCLVISS